ncbi:sensor histidine kinase [Dyella sp. SG609]|uniref:sensor histidine kinase n=1 Tax=Dyella sp. SG609 TaxID=2587018 RepID=UPI001446F2EA|nr:sensor histidine kinase [Dyella sp. SG609]NKJ22940.1 two-component system sensor histidine kinase DesK [Dyella sp. SG609]
MRLPFQPAPDSLYVQLRSPVFIARSALGQAAWIVMLPLIPLGLLGFAWSWFAPTLLSVLVFLYLHLHVYFGPPQRLSWYVAGMAAMGLGLWMVNPMGFGYVITACTALSATPNFRLWLRGVALLTVLSMTMAWLWVDAPLWIMLVVVVAGVLGGLSNFHYINNLRKDADLRLSQIEVRRLATLAERERIGRDLHDLLGHTLSLVAIKSELARRLALEDPPRAQQEMSEVERVARHALAEVRAAVTGMRRSDLASEIISARLMLEASGVSFEGEWPEGIALPAAVEAPLSLVLREAVTNIHRHARATAASVRFVHDKARFQMQISDNGCGGLAAHGNGVSGMRERVRSLGGSLEIDSPRRHGTTLRIDVPLAKAAVAAPRGLPEGAA